jgi:hypothetical protein
VHRGQPLKDVLQFPAPDRQRWGKFHRIIILARPNIHPVAGLFLGQHPYLRTPRPKKKRHDGIMGITASKGEKETIS